MNATEEITPVVVENRIRETVNRIAAGVRHCDGTYREKLRTAAVYDRAFAAAYVAYDGPAHQKRYAAELETEAERTARDAADAAHRYAEGLARGLRDELDALRSLGASLREAYRVAGVGER